MSNSSMFFMYSQWFLTIGLTIALFYFITKKTMKIWKLLLFVILPVWIIVSASLGIENFNNQQSEAILYFFGFILLMAETIAQMLIFSVLPFIIMYKRLKKKLLMGR